LAGETEVLGENLSQRHSVHHKSYMTRPGFKPGRRGGKPATNRLSYGAASATCLLLRNRSIQAEDRSLKRKMRTKIFAKLDNAKPGTKHIGSSDLA
jgi:hypothetical protein